MNPKKFLKTVKQSVNDSNHYAFIDAVITRNSHYKIMCERNGIQFFTILPFSPGNKGAAEKNIMKTIDTAFNARVAQLNQRK